MQFEHGKLPYEDHGKEESMLDVALNFGIPLDHACGGKLRLHHLSYLGEGRRRESLSEWTTTRPTGWTWPPISS